MPLLRVFHQQHVRIRTNTVRVSAVASIVRLFLAFVGVPFQEKASPCRCWVFFHQQHMRKQSPICR